jgi:lipopolysaccharide biosynthesis glycosyltransferase
VVTLRLSLFTPFFKQWGKIVHVDGDVVILGPLNGLLATAGFLAAPDYGATLSAQFIEPHLFKERFPKRYNPHAPAFNAGVFSFSTAIIADDTYSRIRTLFDKYYGYCGFAEQSILNIYFYKTWSALPWEYNTYYRYLPKNKLKWAKGCAIIHFPMGRGVTRPWEDGNPFSKIWNGRLLYENSSRKMRVLLKLRFLRVYYYRRFKNILRTNKVFAVRLLQKIRNIVNFFR